MIAIAETRITQDPTELAVRLAKTRVALAAFKRKHSTEPIDEEDIAHASILRAYYVQSLQASKRVPLDEHVVPHADVRQILQTVLSTYRPGPAPVTEQEKVLRLINYLERLASGDLTSVEAADLIDVLNGLAQQTSPPAYDPAALAGRDVPS